MHKYGSVVLMVRGDAVVNALVVQAVQQADGEHLTVVSLDPDKASPLLSGMNVDAAIRRDFVTPLTEGKTFGWKELPEPELPEKAPESEEQGPSEADYALAGRTIRNQQEEIDDLEKELASVKAELSATTEGIDKQLQGIADATAAAQQGPGDPLAGNSAKEATPEASEDPTHISTKSLTSEVEATSSLDLNGEANTNTSESTEPGSTSDHPLPG